jgi:hypothetical protein
MVELNYKCIKWSLVTVWQGITYNAKQLQLVNRKLQ